MAFEIAARYKPTLTRYRRSQILQDAAVVLGERIEEASSLISIESGLSKQDSRYEIGRVADVLRFSAAEALRSQTMARCTGAPTLASIRARFSRSICIPRCKFTRTDPAVSPVRSAISGPVIPSTNRKISVSR